MNEIAVIIGLISFPGLIATVLCDKLVVHAERWNNFKYGIYTFVFGVSSYVLLQIIAWLMNAFNRYLPFLHQKSNLSLWATLVHGTELNFSEVAWATGLSPVVAVSAIFIANKKIVSRFGRRIGISNKYGEENLFSYFLNSPDVYWLYVRDPAIGLSYRGAIRSFSETKEVQEILLTNVTVYAYVDSEELYQLNSIYLSKPLGSFIMECPQFVNEGEASGRQRDTSEGGSGTWLGEGRSNKGDKHQAAAMSPAASSSEEVKFS